MPKQSDLKKRESAFNTYSRYRDIQLIAKEQGVSVQTVYNWKKEDDWDGKLNDITDKFTGVFSVLKRAETDLAIADKFSELRLLEYLELQAGHAIVVEGLRPKSWNEAIGTLKFVMDRKEKLFDRVRTMQQSDETSEKEETPDITPEQQKSIDAMFKLLQQPDPVDMVNTATETITSSVSADVEVEEA